MHIGAHVLLPEGFDEHPNARYPLAIFHGHFPANIGNFRETPPDPNLKPDYSERFKLEGYNRIVQEPLISFIKMDRPNFPRMLMIEVRTRSFTTRSYAVNSANLGRTATRSHTSCSLH